MDSHENDNVGFQFKNEGIPDSPSSGMSTKPMSEKVSGVTMSSLSLLKPSNEANPFFNSNWDPLVSLSQSENFDGSSMIHHSGFSTLPYPIVMDNQGMHSTNSSHFVRYNPSDPNFIDMVPKLSCFGSGNFSEMVGSFGLPDCTQIPKTGVPSNYAPNKEKVGRSPDGNNRKRGFDSSANKNAETEHKMDGSAESCDDLKEPDEKKLKVQETINGGGQNKENGKQAKDNNNSGEASKENYIHVRARRGQATNSHSLAERVRREKISERMRLLQELVPGCNKITGKAVMLDEIINYVQSLQQQVEFLSMKLATVNPELNIDIERILSKDILNSRVGSNLFGFSPGITTSQPYPRGIFPGTLPTIPNTNPQFPPLNQTALDNEVQGFFHMGFDSNSGIDCLGPNGRLKPEL